MIYGDPDYFEVHEENGLIYDQEFIIYEAINSTIENYVSDRDKKSLVNNLYKLLLSLEFSVECIEVSTNQFGIDIINVLFNKKEDMERYGKIINRSYDL